MLNSKLVTRFFERKSFVALFLFLVSFCVFIPSLNNDFVWDDIAYIEEGEHILSNYSIRSDLIFPEVSEEKELHYRPVKDVFIVLDYKIWGMSQFGFHLSNVIYHSISTLIFYFLVFFLLGEFRISGRESVAFLSSVLFAIYPLHVEPVSFVSARADLICAMFFFLAFLFHIISYRKLFFLVLTGVCFYLSLLSKEVAVTFPVLVIVFDLISHRFKNRNNLLRYSVYGLLILVYFYVRGRAYLIFPEISAGAAPAEAGVNVTEGLQHYTHTFYQIWEVLGTLVNTYLFYLRKLIFPFDLNPFISAVPTGLVYTGMSILVLLLIFLVILFSLRKKEGVTAFSILWIVVNLAPVSLIAILSISQTPVAERFLYIPSAGFCILAGYLIYRVASTRQFNKLGWVFGLFLCASYLFFTIKGQGLWEDNLTLWENVTTSVPNYAVPHLNLGAALMDEGKTDEAMEQYLIVFNPSTKGATNRRKAVTANNIGTLYGRYKHDYENAAKWLNKAIVYDPEYSEPYFNLAINYFILGERSQSVYHYRVAEHYLSEALRVEPSYGSAHLLLAKIYIKLGDKKKARKHAQNALEFGIPKHLSIESERIMRTFE